MTGRVVENLSARMFGSIVWPLSYRKWVKRQGHGAQRKPKKQGKEKRTRMSER